MHSLGFLSYGSDSRLKARNFAGVANWAQPLASRPARAMATDWRSPPRQGAVADPYSP